MNYGQKLNIFSDNDINDISIITNKLVDAKNISEKFKAYTNGFTQKDIMFKIIMNKIYHKISDAVGQHTNVVCGMLLKEFVPWEVHTDYKHQFDVDSTQEPDLAILIPLSTQPNNVYNNTNTVIFNEQCTDIAEFIEKCQNVKKPVDVGMLEVYNTHCSHCTPEIFGHLSLAGIYPWIPGSLIYWDRKMLHCSDNFLKNGITQKNALVLFTSKKN